jgi:hypothetical protein
MKRTIKKWMAGWMGGMLLLAVALSASSAAAETASIAFPPDEETLVYDISFLIFRNAAVGKLTMKYLPERDLYEGIVTAQTKGFIGLLSLFRKDTYRSLMRLSPDGRLIPVEFHKQVKMGGWETTSTTFLDYDKGEMRWNSTEVNDDKKEVDVDSHAIPSGLVFEDFISAFFNLRRGSYGPIHPGQEAQVLALPTKKWFKEGQKDYKFFTVKVGERKVEKDGVARLTISIKVPKELFGQKVGDIRFFIREDKVPSKIVVKKAILFGDMLGKLRSRQIDSDDLAADWRSQLMHQ